MFRENVSTPKRSKKIDIPIWYDIPEDESESLDDDDDDDDDELSEEEELDDD
jgi:hypothetical protein